MIMANYLLRNTLKVCILLYIFLLTACSHKPMTSAHGELAAKTAVEQLGRPYRLGGHTPQGFDCSGLVQYSYLQLGRQLPRETRSQFHQLPVTQYPKKGDLLFFSTSQQRQVPSHVGIYLGNQKMVHAPGSGRQVEIADLQIAYWQQRYLGARTIH